MNTPGHAVVNLVLLGDGRSGDRHLPVGIGALLPDAPMAVFWVHASLVQGLPQSAVWSEAYFRPEWRMVFDAFHSIPIALALLAVSAWLGARRAAWLFGSMALHDLLDLPLHASDAHAHLFPLTDYRFESPVSYWDPGHFGDVVAPLEMAIVLGVSAVLWPRLATRWGRALLVGGGVLYLVAFLFFTF